MRDFRGDFRRAAQQSFDPRYNGPNTAVQDILRPVRGAVNIGEGIVEGLGNIFAPEDAPNKYNILERRHNDGSGPGQYRGPRGGRNGQDPPQQQQQQQRPPEYDLRRFNPDGTPLATPRPGAFNPATGTFFSQDVPASEIITPPSVMAPLQPIEGSPLPPVVQAATPDVVAAPDVAAPVVAAAVDAPVPVAASTPVPAQDSSFDISQLTSGTPLTTDMLNKMSTAGISLTSVGQGPDAVSVFMQDGRIVGGIGDRVGNDASGFMTREQLDTQLASNGKSVAGFETMAGMATVQAATPTPAAEAPAAMTELAATGPRQTVIGPPV